MGQLTPTPLLTHAYLESLIVFEHLDDLVEHLPPQHLLSLASILHRVQEHKALTVVLQPAHQPDSLHMALTVVLQPALQPDSLHEALTVVLQPAHQPDSLHMALTVVLQPAHQPHSLSPLASGTWRPLTVTAWVVKNTFSL